MGRNSRPTKSHANRRRRRPTNRMSCSGKVAYSNRPDARNAMYAMLKRTTGGLRTGQSVYKCGNHFHYGHSRGYKV